MHRLALIISATILAGCSTTPVPLAEAIPISPDRALAFQQQSDTANAKLIVTRDSGMIAKGCYMAFSINGKLAARYKASEVGTFYLEPGEHVLKYGSDAQGRGLCSFASDDYWIQRETILRPGETKRFRLSIEAENGKLDISRSE